jgi:hypothetical protein
MSLFLFQSEIRAGLIAFTRDKTGAILPAEYGPWHTLGNQVIRLMTYGKGINGSDVILASLKEQGYYLALKDDA